MVGVDGLVYGFHMKISVSVCCQVCLNQTTTENIQICQYESRVLKVAIFIVAGDFKYCAKERVPEKRITGPPIFFLLNDS